MVQICALWAACGSVWIRSRLRGKPRKKAERRLMDEGKKDVW
jgi:hypothetical protein